METITSRDETVFDKYKNIRNKVKSLTVKYAQEEQQKISMECKRERLPYQYGTHYLTMYLHTYRCIVDFF